MTLKFVTRKAELTRLEKFTRAIKRGEIKPSNRAQRRSNIKRDIAERE